MLASKSPKGRCGLSPTFGARTSPAACAAPSVLSTNMQMLSYICSTSDVASMAALLLNAPVEPELAAVASSCFRSFGGHCSSWLGDGGLSWPREGSFPGAPEATPPMPAL